MKKETAALDVSKNLRMALFKSLLIPVLLLAFFIAAPRWLNSKLQTSIANEIHARTDISRAERDRQLEAAARLDFQEVALNCPSGLEALDDNLAQGGVVGNFQRLRWGLWLSIGAGGGDWLSLLGPYMR